MSKMKPNTLLWGMVVVMTGLVNGYGLLVHAAAEGPVRAVHGEVMAVNATDSPPVIVVKALSAKKEEQIIGATVGAGTKITRGKQPISLDSIKVGESVTLVYVKSLNGLAAQAIHIQ